MSDFGEECCMQKSYFHPMRGILVVILVCATIAWGAVGPASALAGKPSPAAAPTIQGTGRLVIKRAPNLGPTVVKLSIDGVDTAHINFNRTYDAPLAAGPHVLTVASIPNRESRPVDKHVTMEPGKTYTFTAKRSDYQLVLE